MIIGLSQIIPRQAFCNKMYFKSNITEKATTFNPKKHLGMSSFVSLTCTNQKESDRFDD